MSDQRARRANCVRRAFNLLELAAVVTVVGVLATAAIIRFGASTVSTIAAEGFAQQLADDLRQTRLAAIADGDDHYLSFSWSGGTFPVSYAIYDDGDNTTVDSTVAIPSEVEVTTSSPDWKFEFSGAVATTSTGNTIVVENDRFTWTLTIVRATGLVVVGRVPKP